MENQAKGTNPEETVTDEQLEDVAGGNKIHKQRLEQLETSTKNDEDDKGLNIHKLRLEELDRRDSSK